MAVKDSKLLKMIAKKKTNWKIDYVDKAEVFEKGDVISIDGDYRPGPNVPGSRRRKSDWVKVNSVNIQRGEQSLANITFSSDSKVDVVNQVATMIVELHFEGDDGHIHDVVFDFFHANGRFRFDFSFGESRDSEGNFIPKGHNDTGGGTGN